MSENIEMEKEQTVQEELDTTTEETVEETQVKEEEPKKEEKKGFLKKGNKDKARIEELEKKIAALEEEKVNAVTVQNMIEEYSESAMAVIEF